MKEPKRHILLSLLVATAWASAFGQPSEKISPALHDVLSTAEPNSRVSTWVFFADKGHRLSERLAGAESRLTPHARARRERNGGSGNLVDAYDIAVDPDYVAAIAHRAVRLKHTSRWLNAVSVEVEARAVRDIAALSFVRNIDVVRVIRAQPPVPDLDPSTSTPPPQAPSNYLLNYGNSFTQNDQINVPPLHDLGYSGGGIVICMMDEGFNNLEHVALQHLDIMITHDFVNGDSIVDDQSGQMGVGDHGTWTLSTLGGYAPGELIGPAYGATYILAKTENSEWERHVEEDAWVAAAEWADSIGADIISTSVGYAGGFTNGETGYTWADLDGGTTIIAIGAGIAASRGILVVSSAGNGGPVAEPANTLLSPSDGDSVLSVGAVGATGFRASFSSVGPTADGRIKPDVMAMGVLVRVASQLDTTSYSNSDGTSFAAPLVAGAAALILEANPFATNVEIMDALRQTASQSSAPDRLMGWGIIDASGASLLIAGNAPQPANVILYPAYPNPFNPTTTIPYDLTRTVHVTLTIFDIRGALVTTLVDEIQGPGPASPTNEAMWNGTNRSGSAVASGVYIYRLLAGNVERSRKLVLVR